MSEEECFSQLVVKIYEAASDPSRWVDFLELFAEALRSEVTILWALHPEAPDANIDARVRIDPQCWQEYQERFAAHNIWIQRLDRLVPPGEIRYSEAAISESELQKTRFFNEFLSRWNWDHGFGVKIPYDALLPAHLTSIRSKRLGPFGENDAKLLRLLIPHVRQALRLHAQLAGAKLSLDLIENLDVGIVLLGAGGAILYCNAYARDVFANEDGLGILRGHVVAQSALDSTRLRKVLSRASVSAKAAISAGGEMLISRPSGKRSYIVRVSPVRNFPLCGPDAPVAAVFINDLERRTRADMSRLQILFGLTAAEADVAALLAQGKDVAQIARLLDVKPNTVRIHLKRVFSKTETRNQADLVGLLLASRAPIIQIFGDRSRPVRRGLDITQMGNDGAPTQS